MSKIISTFIPVKIIIPAFFLALFLNAPDQITAACCPSGSSIGQQCVLTANPLSLGTCQNPVGPIQLAQCPATPICISNHNPAPIPNTPTPFQWSSSLQPNTYMCSCSGRNINYNCHVSGQSCNTGYIPDPNCRNPISFDVCGGNSPCIRACVNQPCAQTGDPCNSPQECCHGFCGPNRICVIPSTAPPGSVTPLPTYALCGPPGLEEPGCLDCVNNGNVWTALGCIETKPKGFISNLLTLVFSLAGGIALLLMLYGAFLFTLSAGDPKSAQAGKETFSSAVVGLLIIVFSLILLRLIGADILKLPDF